MGLIHRIVNKPWVLNSHFVPTIFLWSFTAFSTINIHFVNCFIVLTSIRIVYVCNSIERVYREWETKWRKNKHLAERKWCAIEVLSWVQATYVNIYSQWVRRVCYNDCNVNGNGNVFHKKKKKPVFLTCYRL